MAGRKHRAVAPRVARHDALLNSHFTPAFAPRIPKDTVDAIPQENARFGSRAVDQNPGLPMRRFVKAAPWPLSYSEQQRRNLDREIRRRHLPLASQCRTAILYAWIAIRVRFVQVSRQLYAIIHRNPIWATSIVIFVLSASQVFVNLRYFLDVTSWVSDTPPILAHNSAQLHGGVLNWLHTNPERGVGLPPRLYAELHPPHSRIKRAFRSSLFEYHPEKIYARHRNSTLLQQLGVFECGFAQSLRHPYATLIWRRVEEFGAKLRSDEAFGTGFPRQASREHVIVSESTYWRNGLWQNDTLPHLHPDADVTYQKHCTHMSALRQLVQAAFTIPSQHDRQMAQHLKMQQKYNTTESLKEYIPPCNFRHTVANTLENLQRRNMPPRGAHPFYYPPAFWTTTEPVSRVDRFGQPWCHLEAYSTRFACAKWYDPLAWYVWWWGNWYWGSEELVAFIGHFLSTHVDGARLLQRFGIDVEDIRPTIFGDLYEDLFEHGLEREQGAKPVQYTDLSKEEREESLMDGWWSVELERRSKW